MSQASAILSKRYVLKRLLPTSDIPADGSFKVLIGEHMAQGGTVFLAGPIVYWADKDNPLTLNISLPTLSHNERLSSEVSLAFDLARAQAELGDELVLELMFNTKTHGVDKVWEEAVQRLAANKPPVIAGRIALDVGNAYMGGLQNIIFSELAESAEFNGEGKQEYEIIVSGHATDRDASILSLLHKAVTEKKWDVLPAQDLLDYLDARAKTGITAYKQSSAKALLENLQDKYVAAADTAILSLENSLA